MEHKRVKFCPLTCTHLKGNKLREFRLQTGARFRAFEGWESESREGLVAGNGITN